uniref:Interferon stimulated exonuclease 20 like 2 n=1 Tax=Anolis carolinensis TaxID=28377 RepID=H9GMB6_ANOCA|nr:PREDICTED: interferon-stimulated 20 kDa exonuclease-like 2 [Anolis carolinensis]XP_008120260.1 PREDICTED: interferon-stimulated 20 kDa exonuclease-like 2 [Anolis carolinensis]|eukprot:XP_003228457.1 PREDICTED: interferon-stimulated 20 kDa exonuclease-like 2 [Anolis carolinensis]
MSDLIINLDTTLPATGKKNSEAGNKKHQRFIRRRHFLERKGFLKQKQLPPSNARPKRDASHGCPPLDKDKKRQKMDRQDGPASWGGNSACREDGSTYRPKSFPKGNSVAHGAKESGNQSCPPSGDLSCSGKTGSGSARYNGTPEPNCSAKTLPRVDLLSEYESGLTLAPAASKPSKMVAIDCEMVGTGPGGRNSDLARCSVVSYHGDVIYDKYICPPTPITNYRTRWSGIRRHHMNNAVPFKIAQKEILKLLSGKIVIGHAIHNDFKALKYFHPKSLTRDTSKIPLLNRKAGFPENESASLKRLTKQLLHRDIQVGQNGHSSVEDARATMELYKVIEMDWERHLASCPPQD